jgi:hypothetical protein
MRYIGSFFKGIGTLVTLYSLIIAYEYISFDRLELIKPRIIISYIILAILYVIIDIIPVSKSK